MAWMTALSSGVPFLIGVLHVLVDGRPDDGTEFPGGVCRTPPAPPPCLQYRPVMSGCRGLRNLPPTGALPLFHAMMSAWLTPKGGDCVPPWKTNKGKSGFGKASDRAKAKDLRPQGIFGGSVVRSHARLKVAISTEGFLGFPVSIPSALQ